MPSFSYVASTTDNKVVKGTTELTDRAAVIAALAKQNLRPISVKQLKDKKKGSIDLNNLFGTPTKVKLDTLVAFTRQLSAMVGAGVPLLRALSSIEKHA